MPDKLPRNKKGQVLVEAIIAITIITVGLLGVYAFISRSFSLNRVVADQYVGTYLAAEGIELVKNLIDGGYSPMEGRYEVDYESTSLSEISFKPQPLKFDTNTGYYSYSGDKETSHTREIIINWPTDDEIKVVSRVDWITRGGGKFNIELEDHFFNYE